MADASAINARVAALAALKPEPKTVVARVYESIYAPLIERRTPPRPADHSRTCVSRYVSSTQAGNYSYVLT